MLKAPKIALVRPLCHAFAGQFKCGFVVAAEILKICLVEISILATAVGALFAKRKAACGFQVPARTILAAQYRVRNRAFAIEQGLVGGELVQHVITDSESDLSGIFCLVELAHAPIEGRERSQFVGNLTIFALGAYDDVFFQNLHATLEVTVEVIDKHHEFFLVVFPQVGASFGAVGLCCLGTIPEQLYQQAWGNDAAAIDGLAILVARTRPLVKELLRVIVATGLDIDFKQDAIKVSGRVNLCSRIDVGNRLVPTLEAAQHARLQAIEGKRCVIVGACDGDARIYLRKGVLVAIHGEIDKEKKPIGVCAVWLELALVNQQPLSLV